MADFRYYGENQFPAEGKLMCFDLRNKGMKKLAMERVSFHEQGIAVRSPWLSTPIQSSLVDLYGSGFGNNYKAAEVRKRETCHFPWAMEEQAADQRSTGTGHRSLSFPFSKRGRL